MRRGRESTIKRDHVRVEKATCRTLEVRRLRTRHTTVLLTVQKKNASESRFDCCVPQLQPETPTKGFGALEVMIFCLGTPGLPSIASCGPQT